MRDHDSSLAPKAQVSFGISPSSSSLPKNEIIISSIAADDAAAELPKGRPDAAGAAGVQLLERFGVNDPNTAKELAARCTFDEIRREIDIARRRTEFV